MKNNYSVEEIIQKFPEEAAEVLRKIGYTVYKEDRFFFIVGSFGGYLQLMPGNRIDWTKNVNHATRFFVLDKAKEILSRIEFPAAIYDQDLRSVYVNNMDRKNDDDSENKGGN